MKTWNGPEFNGIDVEDSHSGSQLIEYSSVD